MASILVVDDDTDIQLVLREVLEDEGFAVEVAGNGAEALERLEDFSPSLILLDLMMPVMSGAAFRERQLAQASLASIPTVLITADARAHDVARDLGVNELIPKPIGLSELLEVVRHYCSASSAS
jgi:CheY-like chemotaxis protein